MNFGYCEADDSCPDYEMDTYIVLPYAEWGCVMCDHLKNLTEHAIARGNTLQVKCEKGHIILLFVARDKDQEKEG